MKASFQLPVRYAVLALFAGLTALAACFAHWTASSPWAFPRFLVGVVLFFYLPGKFLVDKASNRLQALENLCLSLVLGMATSVMIYWVLAFFKVEGFIFLWPLVSLCLWVRSRIKNQQRFTYDSVVSFDLSHVLLLALFVLTLVPLLTIPLYYSNFDMDPQGYLRITPFPDIFFHLSIAQELTHSIPPQIPFFANMTLSYHYLPDLMSAMFHNTLGVSVIDSTVRFLPTLFYWMTISGLFCLSQLWLHSAWAAVLSTSLMFFGEDFSFIPGLLLGAPGPWTVKFFKVPTIFSLYAYNPMLPALGVLSLALFCLFKYCDERRNAWLFAAALLFAFLTECKIFASAHALFALALAALTYLLVFKDTRLVKVFVLTFILVLPLTALIWLTNDEGARQSVQFIPFRDAVFAVRWLGPELTSQARVMLKGGAVSMKGALQLAMVMLPVYLVGSLGMRVIGMPLLLKTLRFPRPESPQKFLIAIFVLAGLLLFLTLKITPADFPTGYNNAVWFYVQSKYFVWLFVVESSLPFMKKCAPFWKAIAISLLIGLSVPSTIRFFVVREIKNPPEWKIDAAELAMLHFLDGGCPNGEVILSPPRNDGGKWAEFSVVSALTRCRTPYNNLFLPSLVSKAEILQRQQDMASFWQSFRSMEIRSDILKQYDVDYLVVDHAQTPFPARNMTGTDSGAAGLERVYHNERFSVFQVTE